MSVGGIENGLGATCARATNGSLDCWGPNGFGQNGDGANTQSNLPKVVVL